ncbi:uncharacterized protein LOC122645184 [Telopea speciosissima]|uniref:uncharacterized protein LOC122645184 n=1 Tax=Telopea speciosissima TaxID=54955 RepID=UPI001CC707A4|nr:uncharacterized protein LOC122645184 [Telopea speciosissima]
MSCLLEILRCIFCCEDDDGDRRYYRSSDIIREYSYHETPIKRSSSSSLAASYNTDGLYNSRQVTGRTNRDYSNSGSVNSISYGSVNKLPVSQAPLRLPATPSPSKVTQKPICGICLPPQPSPPFVHRKNSVDSSVNETIKSSPAKSNEGTQTRSNLAPTPPAAFSKHSSEAFLSSNKPGICSSGPPQSACKLLLSSCGPLSSTAKTTPACLKAPPSSRGPHPFTSEPTLSLSPSPVQNGPISVVVKDVKYLISTRSRSSSSELGPSPSATNSNSLNLPREKKCVQVQRVQRPTITILGDTKNWVRQPSFPQSLPPATKTPQSSSKLPPFPSELCPSSYKGTPSPTPCTSDKTNPAKKTKLVWVREGTTPISSTTKAIKNLITAIPRPLSSDSDSPSSSSNVSPSLNGTSSFSSMPSLSPFGPPDPFEKNTYFHEDATLIYEIPEDIKNLIKRDIVPDVLKKPLSPWTYKDYFATLLYAEDFYYEKWSKFCLKNVTLKLEKASIYKKSSNKKSLNDSDEYDEKLFVVFEIDLIPERRPFLLSRDFVFLKPAGKEVEPFKGILHRVVRGNRVLAEFGDDFHRQHSPYFKYDINFSFNRVCLKRCHQAIAAATNLLFQNSLFPDQISRTSIFTPPFIPSHQKLNWDQISAVQQILRLRGSPPYLIESSRTGFVIQEAVLQIYKNSSDCRILLSAPTNRTCDMLVESLNNKIPELDIFRANAAFREYIDVPDDILPLCKYAGECFTCPPLEKLQNFKVISSTFMSSFRLHNKGLPAGHFSHIFLVDASSAMEPEALVVLTNLVDENTNVVVTGTFGNSPQWVRSEIGRWNGLKKSYFQRLLESEPYCSGDSLYVTHL